MSEVVVLGAVGTIGNIIVRDLVESGVEVIGADLDFKRLDQLKNQINNKNLKICPLDIRNHEASKDVLKSAKVCVNATNYKFNTEVMKIAAEAKVDVLDLGGLYTVTKEQLKLDPFMKEAGVLSIPGMGSDPGVSNILSRYGVEMLDHAEEIHIRYGSTTTGATFPFAIDTILDEATKNAIVVRNGQLLEIPPLSHEEETKFYETIGVQTTYSILHSELATLPISFPQVKEITYKDTWDPSTIKFIRILEHMGLLNDHQPDNKVSARQKLVSFLRESISENPSWGTDELMVEVRGLKGGKKATVKFELLCGWQEAWNVNALAYVTSIPASIVAQMLLNKEIEGKGVKPPEQCIDPAKFVSYLTQKNVTLVSTLCESAYI
ncbi:SDR family NAD(P)-dependent oxidoreductase [Cohnella pontilimi]|uniref:SDR family NAD(P)-dependent oxidoreductase n=1 Tax=Cohnella pontilimi TaxID=2564100 RepID=A0A4U0FAZ4_9BACL|nr:SDR family NAD(P)-dependent oxidoreductase [Cohnella pontilimi]TJY41334.1 SDR family NAD(P)-dependent oxidoreductase [Cohnella pontilimi]